MSGRGQEPGYFLPYHSSGIKSDVSMHLWFDQGMSCFRWTLRLGGQPWLASAISRKTSANTLVAFRDARRALTRRTF